LSMTTDAASASSMVGGSVSTRIDRDSRADVVSVSLVSMADTLTARQAPAPPAPAVGSTFTFDAIGTRWCIDTEEPLGGEVRDRILDRIRRFDRTYSRFRPDSLVAQVGAASAGGRFEFPEDSVALFDLYDRLVAATDGAVDPLVGRQLELLGYDPSYSLTPAPDAVRTGERARARPTWAADVVRDGTTLITRRPLVIDVGAAGKGYLVDIVSAILQQTGVAGFVVDAGGDLRHCGEHGIRVGLEHPLDSRLVIGVANLQNRALCASAVNRRAWGDGLHHVLDARTGAPATEVVATWVVAGDAALADGLATALFFTGAHRLAETSQFAYVRMFADGRVESSPNFDGELFTSTPTSSRRSLPLRPANRSWTRTMKDRTAPRSKTLLATVAICVAAATAGCATTDTDGTSPSSAPSSSVATSGSPTSRRSNYADGTYTATGQYGGLPSSIGVSVTLVDDVITAVTVTPRATDPTSLDYQTRFAQAVPAVVVGRNIDEVNLSKVAGSSGTPDGFNAAIQQIKAEATN
jgi:FAD:protein FMN transferase